MADDKAPAKRTKKVKSKAAAKPDYVIGEYVGVSADYQNHASHHNAPLAHNPRA